MPFQSQSQRGFLYANNPKVAKKFESETPKGKKLPKHKSKKSKQESAMRRMVKK